ncbi:hypothetical protein DFS34DRAFT_700618 [Phlyctochytrium arcticum]|nr:hypothetical protein DFS34DRAFT_700618 [Phlyctochytrium arcticum]
MAEKETLDPKDGHIAGYHYLRLMKHLRVVFLQDLVQLKARWPNHSIWNHCIFRSPESLAFAAAQTHQITREVDPTLTSLQLVVPQIANTMTSLDNATMARLDGSDHSIKQLSVAASKSSDDVSVMIHLQYGKASGRSLRARQARTSQR